MKKKILIIFCTFIIVMFGLNLRYYQLASGIYAEKASATQGKYTLIVNNDRAMIYDRNLMPLVNQNKRYICAVVPSASNIPKLSALLPADKQPSLLKNAENGKPFLLVLDQVPPDIDGVTLIEQSIRYQSPNAWAHLTGYLNGGNGVFGIEKAFDKLLSGGKTEITYDVAANGTALLGTLPELKIEDESSIDGIILSIDSQMQTICAEIAERMMWSGAAVLMNIKTGEILACVSVPSFAPDKISKSLENSRDPLINRSLLPYSVGSTFKLLTAVNAIEAGGDFADFKYTCTGSINVRGQIFNCHKKDGHGALDMKQAVVESCNPYFIKLAQELGKETLLNMAKSLGFGTETELAPGFKSKSGTLPSLSLLDRPAELANFSFGQGVLTATPLQICMMTSAIANGGILCDPILISGIRDKDGKLQSPAVFTQKRVFSEQTASILRQHMTDVVMNRYAKVLAPQYTTAGGKSATAQTGVINDGNEKMQTWFTGFFPADTPEYALTVLCEDGISGTVSAGPVFKEIADAITQMLSAEKK